MYIDLKHFKSRHMGQNISLSFFVIAPCKGYIDNINGKSYCSVFHFLTIADLNQQSSLYRRR
ncbi:hypothetical protein BY458DRAFT_498538 [Sporodiniella umbellata]|nr:hypothetical protein BY458DRAFT_498538 [Sporodiniella umbellata]